MQLSGVEKGRQNGLTIPEQHRNLESIATLPIRVGIDVGDLERRQGDLLGESREFRRELLAEATTLAGEQRQARLAQAATQGAGAAADGAAGAAGAAGRRGSLGEALRAAFNCEAIILAVRSGTSPTTTAGLPSITVTSVVAAPC